MSDATPPLDPPRPLRPGVVFERLWLRGAEGRLTLSSRGPVARWLLPAINTLPALYLLPTVAMWGFIGWRLVNPPPSAAPPPTGGVAVVMLVMALASGLLPLLLVLGLLALCGVGRGASIELDAERNRCRVRRSRLGLLPKTETCELEDAALALRRRSTAESLLEAVSKPPRRGRLAAGGLLTVLALINPLFLILSLTMKRRREASGSVNPRPTTTLDVTSAAPEPFGGRLETVGLASSAAEAFVAAWDDARRERFRFGFEPGVPGASRVG